MPATATALQNRFSIQPRKPPAAGAQEGMRLEVTFGDAFSTESSLPRWQFAIRLSQEARRWRERRSPGVPFLAPLLEFVSDWLLFEIEQGCEHDQPLPLRLSLLSGGCGECGGFGMPWGRDLRPGRPHEDVWDHPEGVGGGLQRLPEVLPEAAPGDPGFPRPWIIACAACAAPPGGSGRGGPAGARSARNPSSNDVPSTQDRFFAPEPQRARPSQEYARLQVAFGSAVATGAVAPRQMVGALHNHLLFWEERRSPGVTFLADLLAFLRDWMLFLIESGALRDGQRIGSIFGLSLGACDSCGEGQIWAHGLRPVPGVETCVACLKAPHH